MANGVITKTNKFQNFIITQNVETLTDNTSYYNSDTKEVVINAIYRMTLAANTTTKIGQLPSGWYPSKHTFLGVVCTSSLGKKICGYIDKDNGGIYVYGDEISTTQTVLIHAVYLA